MMKKMCFLAMTCLMFGAQSAFAVPTDKFLMGYWSNWSIYADGHGVPMEPYGITGARAADGSIVNNTDLNKKLDKINAITYAFLQVQPSGRIYFNDPNSDLRLPDSFCSGETADICNFAQAPAEWGRGNFEAFTQLQNADSNLRKLISVGGYGHDQSIEAAFASPENMQRFAASAAAVIKHYKLDGLDLDYEPVQMTAEKGQKYAQLVKKLRAILPAKTIICMTIISGPEWIKNFGLENWRTAETAVNYVNLMTYDFHGVFDYPNSIGHQANLYEDTRDPNKFSVERSVNVLNAQGIAKPKIVIGVPAYGRAVESVSSENHGLHQTFTKIPRGDLDSSICEQNLPLTWAACSGTYQYKYILGKMLGRGFTDWQEFVQGKTSASYAFSMGGWVDTASIPHATMFISFDNVNVVAEKARFAKQLGLGGMMMWELRGDVTPGTEGSLLDAIVSGMDG